MTRINYRRLMHRSLLSVFFLLIAFLLGTYLVYTILDNEPEERRQVEATVLLEKVRQVCQLVTVEGNLREIYNEETSRDFTVYLPLPTKWTFTKSALLEVQGKVLVGYDMEGITVDIDSASRVVTLRNLPEPTILAIDHELVYRDLEESWFNSFTPADYTQLNRNAKEVLRRKAYESELIEEARRQGNAIIESIRFMAEAVGYAVVVEPADPAAPPDASYRRPAATESAPAGS